MRASLFDECIRLQSFGADGQGFALDVPEEFVAEPGISGVEKLSYMDSS